MIKRNIMDLDIREDKNDIDRTIDFLKIIAEPNRLMILSVLQEREICVCDIWRCLDLPQNLVSHHLKVLKGLDLVISRKEGTKVFYRTNSQAMKEHYSLLSRYIKK